MSFFQRFSSPLILIRLLVAVGYIALGIFILFSKNGLSFLEGNYRIAIIVLFLAYGIFRLYRALNDTKDE